MLRLNGLATRVPGLLPLHHHLRRPVAALPLRLAYGAPPPRNAPRGTSPAVVYGHARMNRLPGPHEGAGGACERRVGCSTSLGEQLISITEAMYGEGGWCIRQEERQNNNTPKELRRRENAHFTEAGLLSIPVIRANVESAIISLLALESHSSVSSCSPVCFTSSTPIT